MTKHRANQNGFSAVVVILIVVIIGIIGFTGWYVYDSTQKNSKTLNQSIDSQTDPQKSTKNTPTPTKNDEMAGWKTYQNKTVGFSLKYPKDVTFSDTFVPSTAGTDISVIVTPLDKIQDGPMGNTKENIKLDYSKIKNDNDPSIAFGLGVPSSYKIINFGGKAYGKKYTALSGLSICNDRFIRTAHIYKNENYIVIYYLLNETESQKVMKANPTYYQASNDCSGSYTTKNPDLYNQFYTVIEAGQAGDTAQKWFTDFDKMIDSIKFN